MLTDPVNLAWGPLVHWSIGPLASPIGPSVHRSIGPAWGPSVHRSFRGSLAETRRQAAIVGNSR